MALLNTLRHSTKQTETCATSPGLKQDLVCVYWPPAKPMYPARFLCGHIELEGVWKARHMHIHCITTVLVHTRRHWAHATLQPVQLPAALARCDVCRGQTVQVGDLRLPGRHTPASHVSSKHFTPRIPRSSPHPPPLSGLGNNIFDVARLPWCTPRILFSSATNITPHRCPQRPMNPGMREA